MLPVQYLNVAKPLYSALRMQVWFDCRQRRQLVDEYPHLPAQAICKTLCQAPAHASVPKIVYYTAKNVRSEKAP
jgi:hypothetical protein